MFSRLASFSVPPLFFHKPSICGSLPKWKPATLVQFHSFSAGLPRPSFLPQRAAIRMGQWRDYRPRPRIVRVDTNSNQLVDWVQRRFRSSSQGPVVIWGIIGVNAAVFLLWIYAQQNYQNFRDPQLLNWMYQHFTLGLHSGPVSYVLAHFSHKDFFHFAINMFVLHSFGSVLINMLGVARFLALYSISGLTCSATSIAFKNYEQTPQYRPPPSMGASGCVSGLLATFALMYPMATISFIIIPMPAIVAVGGMAAYDLYRATTSRQSRTDSAGHIGGGLGGLLFYLIAL
ncbi:hypothetical protein HDU91_006360 [Kappamyces sp. JEL0680]|nr:hypothetical protein HDU91_006360 [Kappamyces sp. JEL0680]